MEALIYGAMDIPIQNVKLALGISQARAARRTLKGIKVMGRGTSTTQAEAFRQAQSLRDKLLQENLQLMEHGGGAAGLLTGRKARRARKMLGKTETQMKHLEKQKGVKSYVAAKAQETAAAASPERSAPALAPGKLLAGAGLLGGGYLLGNVDRRRTRQLSRVAPSAAVAQY